MALREDELPALLSLLERARANAIERSIAHGGTAEEWEAQSLETRLYEIEGEIDEAYEELLHGEPLLVSRTLPPR